jgi:hypothetical protein
MKSFKALWFPPSQYSPQVLSPCYKCKIEAMPNFLSGQECGESRKEEEGNRLQAI